LPIQLGSPTWRASRKWTKDVKNVNAAAVELLRAIVQQFAGARIVLAGVIGPASDGYEAREALSAEDACAYHRDQVDVLAESTSISSMRRLFHHFQNYLVSPEPWRKPAAHMPWHRCYVRTA
jgi:hypothetical protein